MGTGTAAFIATLALALGVTFMCQKVAKKATPWLMLIAGCGVAGVLGTLLDKVAGGATQATATASRVVVGASVTLVLAVVIGAVLAVRMKPKGKGPSKLTPVLAFVFPSVLIAAGGIAADLGRLLNEGFAWIGAEGVDMAAQIIGSL